MAISVQTAARQTALAASHSTITNLSVGAAVGVRNNEEFSRGGRTNKFSTNAWLSFRPIAPWQQSK